MKQRCKYWGFRETTVTGGRTTYTRFECDKDSAPELWRDIPLCEEHDDLARSRPAPQQDALEVTMRAASSRCKHGVPCPWYSCSICGEQAAKLAIADPRAVMIPDRRHNSHAGFSSESKNSAISNGLRDFWRNAKARGFKSFWTDERRAAHGQKCRDAFRRNRDKS